VRIGIAALIAAAWCASTTFAQSALKRFEAGPIVSSASVGERGFDLGYGGRVGFNVSRPIGVEVYYARHPLPSVEVPFNTVVDGRSSQRFGLDIKLTRRFTKYPLDVFVVGGPALLRGSARWTYVPTGQWQRLKGRDKALHAGGGVELQVRPQWLIRLDLTDFVTFFPGDRDHPGGSNHRVDLTLGTMFRF
jgi:Outer membrane protein beta-barrel domain